MERDRELRVGPEFFDLGLSRQITGENGTN